MTITKLNAEFNIIKVINTFKLLNKLIVLKFIYVKTKNKYLIK